MQRHKVGRHFNRVDAYLMYQLSQNFMFMLNYLVAVPILAYTRHSNAILADVFLFDVCITFAITTLVALKAKRLDILSAFPQIYLFRWISLFVFIRAFVEVVILRKFKVSDGVWGTSGRRYKSEALITTA
jgi:hypothetical protein